MKLEGYKVKIFLWDQLIRPVKKLINRHSLQSVMIALVIVNFIAFKSEIIFWVSIATILLISVIDVKDYWRSGEYMSHYRQEKYPEYRKTIKELKKPKPIENEQPFK